jgi:small-conductance mechanosensitive channel
MVFEQVIGLVKPAITSLVVATVVLIVGIVIGQVTERLSKKILHEIAVNTLAERAGLHIALERGISVLIKYAIYVLSLLLALQAIGLTQQMFNWIARSVFILIALFILLGLRDVVLNIVAGITLSWRKLKVKDTITFKSIKGKVTERGLLEIHVLTRKGDIIAIPNVLLLRHPLTKK